MEGGGGRSVKAEMEELVRSPFEGGGEGPLAAIRRSMMEKKRAARNRARPEVPGRDGGRDGGREEGRSELERAKEKIREAARLYDRYRDGGALSDCFLDYQLTAPELRAALRRSLGVELGEGEAEALKVDSDLDGNGTVDGAEFLLMFFREAQEERSKVSRRVRGARREGEAREREKEEREREDEAAKDEGCFSDDFTEMDRGRVLRRLAQHARKFDALSEDGRRTSACFGCVLRPAGLKEQLLKSFNMKATKRELGALISHFDGDGDGDVSGSEFMTTFNKLGALARGRERKRVEEARERRVGRGMLVPLEHEHLGR